LNFLIHYSFHSCFKLALETVQQSKYMMPDKKILAADLLGKIVLARFLEIPLRAFDQLVKKGEHSPQFDALKSALTVRQLPGMQTARQVLPEAQRALGHVVVVDGGVTFFYHSESYGREYLFNDKTLADILLRSANSMELARLVRRLRLINTRNRITHAIVRKLIEAQADYVRSADPLALRPFSQAQVSASLRAEAGIEVIVDEGRISRLIRKLSIILPGEKEVDLRLLCPKPRQVYCCFVEHVIKKERALMMEGAIHAPLKDGEIAAEIGKKFAARLSRRSVAYIRHDLGIPDYRDRGHKGDYLTATTGFSSLLPLTRQSVLAGAPSGSGVYEIRTQDVQTGVCSVVYIGSAGDLRKRLGDHLRGSSGNPSLMQIIAAGAKFRYRLVCDEWRALERQAYLAFCTTFGVPPACNRMSP
jgi:RNA polymerase sigma-54 factor